MAANDVYNNFFSNLITELIVLEPELVVMERAVLMKTAFEERKEAEKNSWGKMVAGALMISGKIVNSGLDVWFHFGLIRYVILLYKYLSHMHICVCVCVYLPCQGIFHELPLCI